MQEADQNDGPESDKYQPQSKVQPGKTSPVQNDRYGRRNTDPLFFATAPANSAPPIAVCEKASPSDDKDKGSDKEQDRPRSKMPLIILAVVIVLLAIVAFIVWFADRNQVSTDDAFTDGNAVMMAPIVSGYVVTLAVNDNTFVHKGDVLVKIDPRNYVAMREEANAQLALAVAQLESARIALEIARVQYPMLRLEAKAQKDSAQASLTKAQLTYDRQHGVDHRATTDENIDAANSAQAGAQANLENAEAQLNVAALVPQQLRQAQNKVTVSQAQVRQAQAQLDAAELNVTYCTILAPADGWITKRNVQLGSFLAIGTPMFILVTTDLWVTANFKESQLNGMHVGDGVDMTVDAYKGLSLHGHIDSIQLGTGARFAAFPTENATGNFVKIVQRVPVKIVIDRGLDSRQPLSLGLSVSPVVLLK
jgi:membrane fusion protein (multidrug efflux system)